MFSASEGVEVLVPPKSKAGRALMDRFWGRVRDVEDRDPVAAVVTVCSGFLRAPSDPADTSGMSGNTNGGLGSGASKLRLGFPYESTLDDSQVPAPILSMLARGCCAAYTSAMVELTSRSFFFFFFSPRTIQFRPWGPGRIRPEVQWFGCVPSSRLLQNPGLSRMCEDDGG